MRDRRIANPNSEWLTTADVARMVAVTPWVVRYLAREHHLASTTTRSGQHLFRKSEAKRLDDQRAEARLANVRAYRPKKRGVPGEPRQLALFGPRPRPAKATLRLVVGRGSATEALIQRAGSGRKR